MSPRLVSVSREGAGGAIRWPRPWRVLLAICLLAAAGLALEKTAQAQDSSPVERLIESARTAPVLESETLVQALLLSGPRGYDELLGSLRDAQDRSTAAVGTSTRQRLEQALRGVPEFVLARMEHGTIVGRRLELEAGLALRVLGDQGTAGDVWRVLEFLQADDDGLLPPKSVSSTAKAAITQLLRRDKRSFDLLETAYDGAGSTLRSFLLQAVGSYPSADSLRFLAQQLDRDTDNRLIVLAQMGRVAEVSGARPGDRTLTLVLMQLAGSDAAIRREACLTLGRMEEHEALGELINLLEDEDPGVNSAAHWALERISGMRMLPDPDRWRSWLSREMAWWNGEADSLLEALHGGTPGEIATALRQFGTHRLYRHAIAREVQTLLGHERDAIVAQACAALEVLRSRTAVEALELVVAEGNPQTTPHARRALLAIGR